MDANKAHQIKRVDIKIGEHYPFYSTLEGRDGHNVQCRHYTGQHVLVIKDTTEYDDPSFTETQERIFMVRAEDGVEFSAWEGELNDWYFDTRQFYDHKGVWQK